MVTNGVGIVDLQTGQMITIVALNLTTHTMMGKPNGIDDNNFDRYRLVGPER